MTVRIVTDSASDLEQSVCDEFGIEVVPLTIRFGETEFVDRTELSSEEFWRRLETSTVLPETAAPSVGAFEETFRRLADDGADGIVCINLSAQMSATHQSAQVAAKALDGICPIRIVDSKTASMGTGNLALLAARRAEAGEPVDGIVREVEDARDRSGLLATLDTLEYLRKGGRIGGAQALLGSMLSIKPIITVTDGTVNQAGKVRTRSKALRFIADRIPADLEMLSVLHANAPDVDDFLGMISPATAGIDVRVGVIGQDVGVHAGPRLMGVTRVQR